MYRLSFRYSLLDIISVLQNINSVSQHLNMSKQQSKGWKANLNNDTSEPQGKWLIYPNIIFLVDLKQMEKVQYFSSVSSEPSLIVRSSYFFLLWIYLNQYMIESMSLIQLSRNKILFNLVSSIFIKRQLESYMNNKTH